MFDPKQPDNNLPLLPIKDLKLSDNTYWQLSKTSRALATLNTYVTLRGIEETKKYGAIITSRRGCNQRIIK